MSNIIYGKDIQTIQDLQNVVTVMIFRNNIFTIEKVINQAKQLLKSSSLKITDEELQKLIKESLNVFETNGLIYRKNEVYATKPQDRETHVTVLD